MIIGKDVQLKATMVGGTMTARILVVDDDPRALALCKGLLGSQGYFVECVDGAKAALERLSQSTFDLVLTDLMMPEIDGVDLAQMIRNDPRQVDLGIMVMTALIDRETRIRALHFADDVVSKPLDTLELLLRVNTNLTVRHRSRALRLELSSLKKQLAAYEGTSQILKVDVARDEGTSTRSGREPISLSARRSGGSSKRDR